MTRDIWPSRMISSSFSSSSSPLVYVILHSLCQSCMRSRAGSELCSSSSSSSSSCRRQALLPLWAHMALRTLSLVRALPGMADNDSALTYLALLVFMLMAWISM